MPDLHVRRGDKIFGPFPPGKIKQMIADGKIRENDLIRVEDDDQWIKVLDIPNLAKLFDPGAAQYYVKRGTKSLGPLTPNELRSIVAAGKLQRSDQIRIGPSLTWQSAESIPGLFPAESSDDEWSDLASLESGAEQAIDDALDDEYLRSESESATASRPERDRSGSRGGASKLRILVIALICIEIALFFIWTSPSSFLLALPHIQVFRTFSGFVGTVSFLVHIVAQTALLVAVIGIGMRQGWGRKWVISAAVTIIALFFLGVVMEPVSEAEISALQREGLEQVQEHLSEEQRQHYREVIEKYQKENASKISAAWVRGMSKSIVISLAIPLALITCLYHRSWDD